MTFMRLDWFKLKMSPKEVFANCRMIGVLPDVNNDPLVDSTWCLFVNTRKVNIFCPSE